MEEVLFFHFDKFAPHDFHFLRGKARFFFLFRAQLEVLLQRVLRVGPHLLVQSGASVVGPQVLARRQLVAAPRLFSFVANGLNIVKGVHILTMNHLYIPFILLLHLLRVDGKRSLLPHVKRNIISAAPITAKRNKPDSDGGNLTPGF